MVCSNHPSKILVKIFVSPTCVAPAFTSFPPKGEPFVCVVGCQRGLFVPWCVFKSRLDEA